MPIRKFRSVADMEHPQWREPGDPILYRTIAQLWHYGQRTAGYRFPPGVYRHRSIVELNAQTEQWNIAHVQARQSPLESS